MKNKLTRKQELEIEKFSCEETIRQFQNNCDMEMDFRFVEKIINPLRNKIKEIEIELINYKE